MKKVIVLSLIVSVSSLAPAALYFTDNSDITGSTTLSLTADMPSVADMGNYLVAVNAALGTLSPGTIILGDLNDGSGGYPTYYSISYPTYLHANMAYAGLATDGSVSAIFGILGDTSGSMSGLAVTDIGFTHLDGTGIIELYFTTDGTNYSVVDTINVVPEPVSIALLGVGALLIRRRK